MIKEEEIEDAVEWLRSNAREAAQARANRLYLEQYIKTVLARVKGRMSATSNAAAEDMARIDAEYLTALDGYRAAIESDERFRFLREAASAKLEAWRSQQANLRAEGKAY